MEKIIYEKLCRCLGERNVRTDEPMNTHTTFRIGGPADYFVTPHRYEQIPEIISICDEQKIPYYIIGNGSNILVGDRGYRGVIIQVFKNMNEISVDGNEIKAQAGALLGKIAAHALKDSLAGMEFAAGIPGTIGGAVVMNAGAYGGEMKDILKTVTVLNSDGEIERIPASKLEMGYRTSLIKKKQYIVLEAELTLEKGDAEEIHRRMEELKHQRIEKQPLEWPSAGSTFKRPTGYFAGKLIMDAGLRGYRIGGAAVSDKHCGFVINAGNATAKDVCRLMEHVSENVMEQFQVKLEPEIKFLGEFD